MRDLLVFALLAALASPLSAQTLLGVGSDMPAAPVTSPPSQAVGPIDAATSRAALDAFLAVYYDADSGIVSKREKPAPPVREEPSNPWEWIQDKWSRAWDRVKQIGRDVAKTDKADFWWVPHYMEMATDAFELSGDTRDRELLIKMREGFTKYYFWRTNTFNDDLAWWMLASIRAFEVTQDARFRDDAVMLHAAILKSKDDTYGGGIHWKSDGTRFKNVPINAPFVIASMKLAKATGDARYRQVGLEVHDWMVRTLWHDGPLDDGVDDKGHQTAAYTYNYGTFLGACLAVYDETGDAAELARATKAADWAIANLAPGGIVKDEGAGDGAGFKMILTRYLAELAVRPGGEKYAQFLHANARAAWQNRRGRDSVMGYDWSKPAADGSLESFTAAAGVELLFHSRKAARSGAPAPPARP
jgi:predicted alpha-1,6-mannanase (GH76 family)